jgi:signal transduction histidine kinase
LQQEPAVKILITGLKVNGSSQYVSVLGEQNLVLPDLSANQNEVQISFVGLSFAPGELLRYEYRLGNGNWSEATDHRDVTFANLRSGSYRFFVRAINADGIVSTEPAVVAFRIQPPIWLRWWVITLALLALTGIGFAAYRFRVKRLLEIADMRTRIATDLHDDVGANLTRISILSEVAKRQAGNGKGETDSTLSAIAEIARESVASMSDIVWAISPEADTLRDLIRKMRQHADEVFTLRDIELEFNAPPADQDLRLGVNVRRDVLLIFKEAVNNAARHSKCSRVKVDFSAAPHQLCLRIADDGAGFDPQSGNVGRGLSSMKRRAEKLRGDLSIESSVGGGTIVTAIIPLGRMKAATR